MVGAYPAGSRHWDMNYAKDEHECKKMTKIISKLEKPAKDPVTGHNLSGWS